MRASPSSERLWERATTELALEGWQRTVQGLMRFGRTPAGVIVHHDRDPVFTSYDWTGRLVLEDKARVSYALRGARDNTEMESFFGRFKTENRSLIDDAQSLEALRIVVASRIEYFNRERRHSTLSNRSPLAYLAERGYETTKRAGSHCPTFGVHLSSSIGSTELCCTGKCGVAPRSGTSSDAASSGTQDEDPLCQLSQKATRG